MNARRLSDRIVPSLLALCGALLAANWYASPARAGGWSAALLLLVVMACTWLWARGRRAAADVSTGVILGSLMIVLALAATLAPAFGAHRDPEGAERATMVVLGAFFVIKGNAIPKTLTPLTTLRGDPGTIQAARFFAGWMWVLIGLAFAAIWLLAPMSVATPASMAVLLGGTAIIAIRSHGASSPTHFDRTGF